MILHTSWRAGRENPPPDRGRLRKLILRIAELACPGLSCASVTFLTPDGIAAINERFLGHHGATDVICFDYRTSGLPPVPDEEDETRGEEEDDGPEVELFLCPAVAAREAAKRGLAYSSELTLYLVHGFLHAGGFDDLQPALKRKMRAAEKRVRAALPPDLGGIFRTADGK